MKSVKKNLSDISTLSLYLYEELPLSIWRPTKEDMEIISWWLLKNPITSNESKLARMIISRLNWGFADETILFLPFNFHCEVALLCAQAVEQDMGYNQWAWQTLFRLKLHINDGGHSDYNTIQDPDQYDVLKRGLKELQPLPSFLSILLTSWGHLVPLIYSNGFQRLNILIENQKFDAVIFSLSLIAPLFLDCQESLVNNEHFLSILQGLLNADKGYVNMAKSLVMPQNSVLEHFGNMLEYQITNFFWYKQSSPRLIVRLWMNSLISVTNWNRDYGVMYLLDVIIRAAFFHADAIDAVYGILRDLLQCSTPQEQTNSISSIFKWVSQSNAQSNSLINSSMSSCTWLAYIIINLEHEERERRTGLWKEILLQLKKQKGKVNVDAAIKKAAGIVKVGSFSSGSLCLFRWAQQALDSPVDHPLLPLLWQNFFLLYLCRVPVCASADAGCVGGKFFEGIINLAFMKRLKKKLQETVDYYKEKSQVEDLDTHVKMFYDNCLRYLFIFILIFITLKLYFFSRLFKAYSLWLEEPCLQEACLFLPGLPPQYEPKLLALIIQGNTTPWNEYINYDLIKEEQQKAVKCFKCVNFRDKSKFNQPLTNPGSKVESSDPVERILRRLSSYDVPKPLPDLSSAAPVIPHLNFNNKTEMFRCLEPFFFTLKQFAQ